MFCYLKTIHVISGEYVRIKFCKKRKGMLTYLVFLTDSSCYLFINSPMWLLNRYLSQIISICMTLVIFDFECLNFISLLLTVCRTLLRNTYVLVLWKRFVDICFSANQRALYFSKIELPYVHQKPCTYVLVVDAIKILELRFRKKLVRFINTVKIYSLLKRFSFLQYRSLDHRLLTQNPDVCNGIHTYSYYVHTYINVSNMCIDTSISVIVIQKCVM